MDLVILAISFVLILAGAELFTNGIEWFGRKLGLAEGAVGSVLAAVGTALPETMIPIIAIVFASGEATSGIGVGAILGAPFMFATLAMFVTGAAVVWQGRRRPAGDVMPVDVAVLGIDMRTFALAYGLAVGAAFLPLRSQSGRSTSSRPRWWSSTSCMSSATSKQIPMWTSRTWRRSVSAVSTRTAGGTQGHRACE